VNSFVNDGRSHSGGRDISPGEKGQLGHGRSQLGKICAAAREARDHECGEIALEMAETPRLVLLDQSKRLLEAR